MGKVSMAKLNKGAKFVPNKETKMESTLKQGVDYDCKVIEPTKSIKDIVGEEAKLISHQFTLGNNVVTFYLNDEKKEILIDKVDYLNQDARLLIKLLNIQDGYKFKNISVVTTCPGIFVMLSKSDSQNGCFMKAIKLNDIVQIRDGNRVYHGN